MCLPQNSRTKKQEATKKTSTATTTTNAETRNFVYGTIIEKQQPKNNREISGTSITQGVCSVCQVTKTTTIITIPGRYSCPGKYQLVYHGRIMAQRKGRKRTQYVCADVAQRTGERLGGLGTRLGVWARAMNSLNFVEKWCGVFGCWGEGRRRYKKGDWGRGLGMGYKQGAGLSCVVCSK